MRDRKFQHSLNRWRDDEEAVLVEMKGDDSDEGNAVPAEWSQTSFIECSVAEA
jgi:hypothetical protein